MRCARVRDRLDDLLDDRLGDEERRRVEAHLETCPRCAARFGRMTRVLRGIRRMPRPAAPVREVPVPSEETLLRIEEPRRPARRLRVAAAVLLFAALAVTHVLAFYLGGRKNRDLAEIGKRELPRLVTDHLAHVATQLRFAREVAAEDPGAVPRLVLNDTVGRALRARSDAFCRVSDQPALKPVQTTLAQFVRAQDDLYGATGSEQLRRGIARMEEKLNRLKDELARVRARSACVPRVALDDADAVVRVGRRLLEEDRPAVAARLVARHLKRHENTPHGRVLLWIIGESSRRLGKIVEPDVIQAMILREGESVLHSFFGPLTAGSIRRAGQRRSNSTIRLDGRTRGHGWQYVFPGGPGPLSDFGGLEVWFPRLPDGVEQIMDAVHSAMGRRSRRAGR